MRIWFISDTHKMHSLLEVPVCDMVIHCGDEANAREPEMNAPESRDFFDWFGRLPIRHKLFVPGNHSTALHKHLVEIPENVTMLVDKHIHIEGLNFYGSPWTPWTPSWGRSWAWMRDRGKMQDIWSEIPVGTDVLITHGPPKGILDVTHDHDTGEMIHVGCKSLRTYSNIIRPKVHAFGHIHDESGQDNFGVYSRGPTSFINCSVCNIRGDFRNNGILKDVNHG